MALIINQTKRFDHPSEPGAWVELRPIRAGDLDLFDARDVMVISKDLIAALLVAWSYDQPPSRETLDLVDIDTLLWLTVELKEAILSMSGIRQKAEQDSLAEGSSLTSGPDEEPSRQSSATS